MTDKLLPPDSPPQAAVDAARVRQRGLRPELVKTASEVEPERSFTIAGYLLHHHGRRFGPFGSANDAAEWAQDRLPAGSDWSIHPFLDRSGKSMHHYRASGV